MSDGEQTPPTGESAAREKAADRAAMVLDGQLRDAKQKIMRAPRQGKGNRLYAVPWFLFLGAETAQSDALLTAGAQDSPFPPPERLADDEPAHWYWWFLKTMIAIEASPSLICEAKDKAAWGIVEQALSLLGSHRPRLPLNGLVAVVDADALLNRGDEMAEHGRLLRGIVDEAYKTMSLRFPIYVVVTGLQALPGHASFFGPLPDGVERQVIGCRLEPGAAGTTIQQRFDDVFFEIRDRLHGVRLALLKGAGETTDRRGIFDFVEVFTALHVGLSALHVALYSENPFQHQPMWRGLYFTAAGTPTPHVADLFRRFLPTDASLATRS